MFKPNDRVKFWDVNRWVFGTITIIRENESKVLFDDSDLNYWYYPNDKLILVEEDENQRPT